MSKRKSNTKKKKRKGFTLIELLAVIIILGVLMIIAIPAVTTYISNSRKSAYISSAKNLIGGARNIVNSGKLEMYDTSATYYIPIKYVNSENETRSPYGAFTQAYVGVIYNGKGYNYYWISNDTARQGIKNVTAMNLLENDLIESNVNDLDIRTTVETTGIDGRTKILILGDNWKWEDERIASLNVTNDGFTEESDLKKSTFINGYDFNVKLKTLAGDNPTDYSTVDTNIKYIKYSATEPTASNKTAANLISTSGSEFPIYAWYSNGTIYWWSEDDKPNMNEISPYMFYNMRGLINIPEIGNMRTNNTVDMRYMFGNCINYEIIDVSSFVTRNVTDMRGMFYVNYQWNTTTIRSNVKEIRGLQNFNTSKVRNMNVMFHGQIKIKTLDLSSFDTSQVVDMSHMFGNCFALVNLNLSSFNTKNVQSMAAMFQHTTAIEVIDLSSFDTSNVVYMNHMFGCGGNNELC